MKKFLNKVAAFDGSGSGPVGTKRIEEGVEFEKGKAKAIDQMKAYPWSTKDKRVLPDEPIEAPKVEDNSFPFEGRPVRRVPFIWNDEKPTPEEVEEMLSSFLKRVESKTKQEFFPDFLKKIKMAFPDLKMKFPKPPTYVWNPKDENAPLEVKKIKDLIKIRVPDLVWSDRHDGVDAAEIDFPDMTYAELAIGQDADHLTITYHVEGRK